MPPSTPNLQTHTAWLGLVQPVGLVVAPAVLSKLELFPNQGTAYLSARQRQLEALLEERENAGGEPIQVVPSFQLLATELLDWGEADLIAAFASQAPDLAELLPRWLSSCEDPPLFGYLADMGLGLEPRLAASQELGCRLEPGSAGLVVQRVGRDGRPNGRGW
jgi:hypothetical protein